MVDHLVAPDQGALDVERGLLEAHARNPVDLVHHLPGAQERLRRHAGVVGALAPHQLALDHDDVESVAGQPARAHLAGGAGSHHDGVDRSLGAHGIASTVLPAMSEADTGAAAADRPLTEGELWAREQLTALLAARFSPPAAGRFLLASQRRAKSTTAFSRSLTFASSGTGKRAGIGSGFTSAGRFISGGGFVSGAGFTSTCLASGTGFSAGFASGFSSSGLTSAGVGGGIGSGIGTCDLFSTGGGSSLVSSTRRTASLGLVRGG